MQYTLTRETSGNKTITYGRYEFDLVQGEHKRLLNAAVATACWVKLKNPSTCDNYDSSPAIEFTKNNTSHRVVIRNITHPNESVLTIMATSGFTEGAMDYIAECFTQWELEYGSLLQGLVSLLQAGEIKGVAREFKNLRYRVADTQQMYEALLTQSRSYHKTHISSDGEITEDINEASLWATVQAMDWALVELHRKVAVLQDSELKRSLEKSSWYKRILGRG